MRAVHAALPLAVAAIRPSERRTRRKKRTQHRRWLRRRCRLVIAAREFTRTPVRCTRGARRALHGRTAGWTPLFSHTRGPTRSSRGRFRGGCVQM